MQSRASNNLNAIRLVLAILVILDHSFPLTLGKKNDPLYVLSHQQTTIGGLAVDLFFFISGFLITASWLNCKTMNDYMRRRILRIFPGFLVALIFSFVVASAFAAYPFGRLPGDLSIRLHEFRDFFSLGSNSTTGDWIFPDNPTPGYSNGSLWTIRKEFVCYLLVAAIGLFGFFQRRILVLTLFLVLLDYYAISLIKHAPEITYRFETFFFAGCITWLWRDKVPVNHTLAVLALAVALITTQFPPFFMLLMPLAASYLVLWAGYAFQIKPLAWCDRTDLSYGVYLFAFPVQQALVAMGMSAPWSLFAVATLVTLGIAWLSWHLVEKPCLNLKSRDFSDHDPCRSIGLDKTANPTAAKISW